MTRITAPTTKRRQVQAPTTSGSAALVGATWGPSEGGNAFAAGNLTA